MPEWQFLKIGDGVPIWRNLEFPVVALEPRQYLVLVSPSRQDSMALGLYPVDATHTRLVWRIHLGPYSWGSPWIFAQLVTDLADFLAVRQNLCGIKARAEGRVPESPKHVYTELLLWMAYFVAILATEIVLLLRKALMRPLLAAAATGLLTAWLVLLQPPLWLTTVGTLASWALLRWAVRADWPKAGKELQPQAG